MIEAWIVAAAFLGGATASIVGFGLGSFLTPAFALILDPKLAVAAVAFPHLATTIARTAYLVRKVDWPLLRSFGLTSAFGGLVGALAHKVLAGTVVLALFGCLLLAVGIAGLAGWSDKVRFTGWSAWLAGAISGVLGGIAGNQGGIRSGAMLGLGVGKEAFVATATATGLLVDLARTPVYAWSQGSRLLVSSDLIALAIVAALAGTFAGRPLLARIPEKSFRAVVSIVVLLLGGWVLAQAIAV